MSRKYYYQFPHWLLITNKTIKIILLSLIFTFSFLGKGGKVLVEGSPTVIIDEDLPVKASSNIDDQSFNPLVATLIGINNPQLPPKKIEVIVTAYSSSPDETDDTPFITASGKVVQDGFIAANFLEFGTKVRFPELFGEKIFVVEDRMHERFSNNRVDIWYPTKEAAKNFGVKHTIMEIIEEPTDSLNLKLEKEN